MAREVPGFPERSIESLAANRPGAIKIGPFGSQLRKEEMVPSGRKVYGQENIIAGDWTIGDRRVREAKFQSLSSCRLEPGDVVLTMMGTIGKCAVFPESAEPGLMDSHLLRIQPDLANVDRNYLRLVVQAEQIVGRQFAQMSHGSIMSGLSSSIVRGIRVPVAPMPEQRHIAEILDTLDEAARQTEQLIAKLKQVKQGLLHDLLTRGMNDNGELRDPDRHPEQFRDSPLGRIPKRWRCVPLGEACDLQVGFAFKSNWFSDYDGIRLLRGENVGYGEPDWVETKRLPEHYAHGFSGYLLGVGDVVIGMDRTFTKSGVKVSVIGPEDTPALLVQRVGRFGPRSAFREFIPQLLCWPVLHAGLLAQQKGMDIPHLSKTEILSPLVPLPNEAEQKAIANTLSALDLRCNYEQGRLAKLLSLKKGLLEDLLSGRVRTVDLGAT